MNIKTKNLKKKEAKIVHSKKWQHQAIEKVFELGMDGAICYYRDVIKKYTNNIYYKAWIHKAVAEWKIEFIVNDLKVSHEISAMNKYKTLTHERNIHDKTL